MNTLLTLPLSDALRPTRSYHLSNGVAVIRLVADENGVIHSGGLSELPKDADVDLCGDGFNERTVTVCWRGEFFFVYRQDLECPLMSDFIE
ncbi:MAG: hypothetical protein WAM39_20130 [Bryobacteraceae bacterium]